jgi:glyoxylase-like metal-dependent hydrolase (beta-lactamase superfamily II)
VIDSPIFPEELESVPSLLLDSGFTTENVRLFSTHGDWDHLLGSIMFPKARTWCGESTIARLADAPDELETMMREFDEMFYVDRTKPTLDKLDGMPVPGELAFGSEAITLIQSDGHTRDGTTVLLGKANVLVVGDYVSPVEIPHVRGSVDAYLATLDRLEGVIGESEVIIPGHGHPMRQERALQVLREDRAYLGELLTRGDDAQLPQGRNSAEQLRSHREINVPAAGNPRQSS